MNEPRKCQETVYHSGMFTGCRCDRRAVVDGKWCRQHDPEAVKAKRAKREAEWNEKWKQLNEESDRAAARQRALLDGMKVLKAIDSGGWMLTREDQVAARTAIADFLAAGGKLDE